MVAAGSGTLSYQWRRNGVSISGAMAASYTTPPTVRLRITGRSSRWWSPIPSGSVISNNALLTVVTPPSIVTQPVDATVNAGQTATFSVTAAGTSPLAYQWRRNGVEHRRRHRRQLYHPGHRAGRQRGPVLGGGEQCRRNRPPAPTRCSSSSSSLPNNRKLAISGELVDAAGNPLGFPTPVTVDAIVTLLDAATGGTTLYRRSSAPPPARASGSRTASSSPASARASTSQNLQQVLTANPSLWAEITIDDGSPDILSPRTPDHRRGLFPGRRPRPRPRPRSCKATGDPNTLGVEAAVGADLREHRGQHAPGSSSAPAGS